MSTQLYTLLRKKKTKLVLQDNLSIQKKKKSEFIFKMLTGLSIAEVPAPF